MVEEEGLGERGLEGGGPDGEFVGVATPEEPDCAGGPRVAEEVGEGGGDGAVPGEEADAKGEGSGGGGGCGWDEGLAGKDSGRERGELVADAEEAHPPRSVHGSGELRTRDGPHWSTHYERS